MPQLSHDPGVGAVADQLDRVAAGVRHQLGGQLRSLRLEVADGGLVLRGRAGTYHARLLAQDAVLGATGLPILRNEIEVT